MGFVSAVPSLLANDLRDNESVVRFYNATGLIGNPVIGKRCSYPSSNDSQSLHSDDVKSDTPPADELL